MMDALDTEGQEVVFIAAEGGAEVIEDAQEFLHALRILPIPRGDRGDAAEAGAVVGHALAAVETGWDERTDICGRCDALRLVAEADIAVELRQGVRIATDLARDQRLRRLCLIHRPSVRIVDSRRVELACEIERLPELRRLDLVRQCAVRILPPAVRNAEHPPDKAHTPVATLPTEAPRVRLAV